MTDVVNGVNVEQMNEMVQSIEHNPILGKATFHATTKWIAGGNVKTKIREFTLEGDEPPELLGTNRAPNAVEAVLHALGACLAASFVYHGAARGITVHAMDFDIMGELDIRGYLGISDAVRPGYQNITVSCRVATDAPPDAMMQLWEQAQRVSPVLDIIRNPVPVSLMLERKA